MERIATVLAMMAAVAPALETESHIDETAVKDAYFKFVALYGKSYASIDHMSERYDVFRDNYIKIETHNSSVDEKGRPPPFRLGIN